MNRRELLASSALLFWPQKASAGRPGLGADQPWVSYQAEAMKTNGAVLGPAYGPFRVESEAINQTCVKLSAGQTLHFKTTAPANTMVIRYSLPDASDGSGVDDTLTLYRNGKKIADIALTSRFTWLYGAYPFSNNPEDGRPRHFFHDVRVKDLHLAQGDLVTLKKNGAAAYCIVDLVDLEYAPPPLSEPENALSLADFGADGKGESDNTEALRTLLAKAAETGKIAYVPPGDYKLTGDIEMPAAVTLQGAGMWHTTFVGDEALYPQENRRLRLKLTGTKSRLADFALAGKLKYRNDDEQNDGIFGAGGSDCTVSRLWIEGTKVGMWFYLCRAIHIEGCRLRNTFADGINLCVDTRDCRIENCSARNTGDDGFAIWPAQSDQGFVQEAPAPGNNVIRRCTAQAPFLAQGISLYGGAGNRVEDCLVTDIASGCGILISTTFPTAGERYDNNFSGLTEIRNCRLVRCGGYDHGWTWRGALQICLHRKDIANLRVSHLSIEDSLSDGISIVTAPDAKGRRLSDAVFEHITVKHSTIAVPGHRDLFIAEGVTGEVAFNHCRIPAIKNDAMSVTLIQR